MIGPKPYFFVKDGEIKGSDKLMAGYLAKRLNFEYELVRPKGAFSGMVSAVMSALKLTFSSQVYQTHPTGFYRRSGYGPSTGCLSVSAVPPR